MYVATTKDKVQAKLSDKGTVCVFVGYMLMILQGVNDPKKSIIKSTSQVQGMDFQSPS
jgi:hypothetical protein